MGKMDQKLPEVEDYPETHFQGMISFEQDIKRGTIFGDLGVQISKDGRVWICLDGVALIRLKRDARWMHVNDDH